MSVIFSHFHHKLAAGAAAEAEAAATAAAVPKYTVRCACAGYLRQNEIPSS